MNATIERRRVSAIILTGAVLATLGNAIHPFFAAGTSVESFLLTVSTTGAWRLIHLLIAVALALLAVGVVLFARLLGTGPGSSTGAAAAVLAVIGAVIFIVQIAAVDGTVLAVLADQHAAGGGEAVLANAEVWLAFDLALLSLSVAVFLGATFVTLGWALRQAELCSPWIRWTAITGGAVGLLVGVLMFMGIAEAVTTYAFRVVAFAVTIAAIGLGVQIRREPAVRASDRSMSGA
jgi:hypothetical protein